ncbi:MAG: flippase [Terracidiphilus sp.]
MEFLRNQLRILRQSSLARNAGWMAIGHGCNILLQAAYFILLARLLGVREYGVFAGAFAFVTIATPYSALGFGLLFVRYVSTDAHNFAVYWGNILLATFGVGSALTVLLVWIAPHLLNPASASLILMVALGDCICRQLVICVSQVFQAFEQLRMTATITLMTSFLRLLMVIALALSLHHVTAGQWALSSLVISALSALVASAIVMMRYGGPKFAPRIFFSRFGEGFGFSLAGSTQSAYNDIDKTMLSHYGMNVANGIYTMAYRIVDVSTVPVTALDAAALPRFFRQSQEGPRAVASLSVRLAKRAALLGITMSACMFFAAPMIPHIVGNGFKESVIALRWLCLIPVFRGIHQLTGSAITGLGYQRYRTVAQLFAASLNLGMNLWLIPRYGWIGAAWASLATDGSLGIVNWLLLKRLSGPKFNRSNYARNSDKENGAESIGEPDAIRKSEYRYSISSRCHSTYGVRTIAL